MTPRAVKRRKKKALPKKTARQTYCFSDHSTPSLNHLCCSAWRVILSWTCTCSASPGSSQLSPAPPPCHSISSLVPESFVSFYSWAAFHATLHLAEENASHFPAQRACSLFWLTSSGGTSLLKGHSRLPPHPAQRTHRRRRRRRRRDQIPFCPTGPAWISALALTSL